LRYVKSAAETVGKNLKKGATVVLESTVYPGVTEEVVAPVLERESIWWIAFIKFLNYFQMRNFIV